jgi:hypothetical protein
MSVTVRVSATRSLCHWRPRVDTITAQTVGELIDTLRRNLTDRGASLETANHLIAAAFLFPHNWGDLDPGRRCAHQLARRLRPGPRPHPPVALRMSEPKLSVPVHTVQGEHGIGRACAARHT